MNHVLTISGMLVLAACQSASNDVISSIAYLDQPIDTQCAYGAIRDTDGFAVTGRPSADGTAVRVTARFNDDMPVQVLIRSLPAGGGELSTFVRLQSDASPLDRRAAEFAVRQADQAIYRSCTDDGRTNSGANVILQTEDQK